MTTKVSKDSSLTSFMKKGKEAKELDNSKK